MASRWRHCADLTGPGIEPQTSRTESERFATELTAGLIKSSLYSRYYAEACNESRGPSPRLSARATQLRRNVAMVASRWRHCADLPSPGIEPQTSRTESVRLATELTAGHDFLLHLLAYPNSHHIYFLSENNRVIRLASNLDLLVAVIHFYRRRSVQDYSSDRFHHQRQFFGKGLNTVDIIFRNNFDQVAVKSNGTSSCLMVLL